MVQRNLASNGVQTLTPEIARCIDACRHCATMCMKAAHHGLQLGGEWASVYQQTLLHDCSDLCETHAAHLIRMSPRHRHTAALCATVCDECAQACERMANGSPLLAECAAACRHCAEMCGQMSASAPQPARHASLM